MRRLIPYVFCLSLVAAAVPSMALNPGTDIIVPAAAKSGNWVTDLYVMNPGDSAVNGTVFWLVRDQPNPAPVSVVFTLNPGETAVMADIIGNDFGLDGVGGAFHVVADAEVVVNSRIYSLQDGATLGQGFEGVPAAAATAAGQTTSVVGLSQVVDVFRTNFYACAGANGATMDITIYDPAGTTTIATGSLTLGAYEPYLKRVALAPLSAADFADGTLMVSVTAGSAVVGASKVDESTEDPTTLESSVPMGAGGTTDGTYQISLYDSETFAAGGNLVISGGQVTAINGTYMNWDKDEDSDSVADCPYQFLWGLGLTSTDVADFASGVEFTDSYAATGSGDLTFTVTLEMNGTTGITGTIDAVGANFPSSTDPALDQTGCNGTFDQLVLVGGKAN